MIAKIELVMVDILDYLSKLVNVYVGSVRRECNEVAHSLVCLSKTTGYIRWLGCVPVRTLFPLTGSSFVLSKKY
jgi:hypothetical protein